ncbi:hypothetical protein [Tellurirhabdus bombi]|uniref:hypothetical protein n=1 Tax=Tellurirhabdus bombi TaxID=2907205 RepID=UPI001F1658C1|nr:hypothetical protein [Tellurirhabdus bombi]
MKRFASLLLTLFALVNLHAQSVIQVKLPASAGYGWTEDWVKNGENFTLPFPKTLIKTPTSADVPAAQYLLKGATHIKMKGVDPTIPRDKRATIVSAADLRNYAQVHLGGKPIAQFSQAECAAFASDWTPNYYIIASEMQEAYGGDLPWKLEHGSQQERWMDQAFQSQLDALGGQYFGAYDGHISTSSVSEALGDNQVMAQIRNALLTNEASLAWAKAHPLFGNGLFSNNDYQVRNGIIKSYHLLDPSKFMASQLFNFQISKQALAATASTRQLQAFLFPIGQEFTNQVFTRKIPTYSGYWSSAGSNHIPSASFQVGFIFQCFAHVNSVYSWNSGQKFGSDPTKIPSDGGSYVGGGSSPPVGNYPPAPYSAEDYPMIAAYWYTQAANWAGQAWQWVAHKPVGGNYISVGADYTWNRFKSSEGYAQVGSSGNKRWLFYMNTNVPPGKVERRVINLGGGYSCVGTFATGVPYLYLIDVTGASTSVTFDLAGNAGSVVTPPTPTPNTFVQPDVALTYYLDNDDINIHTASFTQFKNSATNDGANNNIKVGVCLEAQWNRWETSPGVYSSARQAQTTALLNHAQSNGLKMGFRPVCLRDYDAMSGFLTDYDCQIEWTGQIGTHLRRRTEHFEYSHQALTQPNGLQNSSNVAVKGRYNFVKYLTNFVKPWIQNGTVTFAVLGTGANQEANYSYSLDHAPPHYGDFHEVVRQGYVARFGLPSNTQLPVVNSSNAWEALTLQANRNFTQYRHEMLAQALALQAVAIYEVAPGLPLYIDTGQSIEGGGLYASSFNTFDLIKRVRATLAARFPNATIRVYLKKNPAPAYDMEFDGAFAAAHSLTTTSDVAYSATEQDFYTASKPENNNLVDGTEGAYQMAQKAVAAWQGAGGNNIIFLAQCQDHLGGSSGQVWLLANNTARQIAQMGLTNKKGGPALWNLNFNVNTYLNNPGEYKGNARSQFGANQNRRFYMTSN